MSNPSVMNHNFSQIPKVDIPRSSFDRSHGWKGTFDAGPLVPILVDEALPGDTFNLSMTAFARLATPIKPIMDNLFLETFFFAVPMRLVWENWEKFNGAQDDPGDSTDYVIPSMSDPVGVSYEFVHDYMGIPPGVANLEFSALPARAYSLIWNEWFRDQNLQPSASVPTGDAGGSPNDFPIRFRNKKHDYFTSALPWPQKGDAVSVPLGTTAPIISAGDGIPQFSVNGTTGVSLQSAPVASASTEWSASLAGNANAIWDDPKLQADLSTATAATINQLRQAFQTQKLLERDARGGTRYTEIIRSHFGVTSPDARLQRPEYLGGGSSMINISPIAQTTSTDATTPQGNLAAMGTATINNHGFTKSFSEHCIIIGLANVRADITYQQGLDRMWSRQTRYDFYWPSLAHIGEQAILNKEIYAQGTAVDDNVWAYQERYGEYRYKNSLITGKFRSSHPQSLDYWHLSEEFGYLPSFNGLFIPSTPPVDRVIAVPSEPQFLMDAFFKMKCARPMPLYGVPGMIDHF